MRKQDENPTADKLSVKICDDNGLAQQTLSWAASLFSAIEMANSAKRFELSTELASIGSHLADSWSNYHNCEAEEYKAILERVYGKPV